jgi:hypothetical protein
MSLVTGKRKQLLADPLLRNYLGRIAGVHGGMYNRYTEEKNLLDSLYTLIDKHLME